MKAIATIPTSKIVNIIDRDEPFISSPDEIKIKITQVGICGTDREIANGGRADAPEGSQELVIGHEMLGIVHEVGSSVSKVKVGDYALFIVRRPCGECKACFHERSDMCSSKKYTERGIKMRDGYMTEYVVDKEEFILKVPNEIADIAVLTEPLSVSIKAIVESLIVQSARLPGEKYDTYLEGKKVLVVGLGPIGLLGAFALRLRGAEVIGMDIVDENSTRPSLLKEIGGKYINDKLVQTDKIDDQIGQIDMIFEATGVAKLEFDLIDALGVNGIYVLTGIPGVGRPVEIMGGDLMQQMVLMNQVLIGSVNASKEHNQIALNDLIAYRKKWGKSIDKVITEIMPYTRILDALANTGSDEIKTVITF